MEKFIRLFSCMIFTFLLINLSCKKSNSSSGSTIIYEVTVSDGNWGGDYFSYNGSAGSLVMISNQSSGWKYSFTVAKGQVAGLVISAVANNSSGIVSCSIYVNGKLVASNSGTFGATAQYTLN